MPELFFFSSRRRHTRCYRDWSSDVCSSDLGVSVYAHGAFGTPLGEIPIDEALAQALLAADDVMLDEPSLHRDEHSLEMQLPFLQHLVPGLRIVPLLMGSQDRAEVEALAR